MDELPRSEVGGDHVVVSELVVPAGAGSALEAAFANRLGEVEAHDGFRKLEVWSDARDPNRYLMVSWWRDREAYVSYMRSDAHDRSHARIPAPPNKPRGVGVTRYEVVAR